MHPNPFARLLRWPRPLLTLVVALLIVLMGFQEGLLFHKPAPATATMLPDTRQQMEQRPAQAITGPALLQLGKDYYNAGQFADAAAVLTQAEDYFIARDDILYQAVALSNRALAYRQLGRIEDGITIAQTSIGLLEAMKALPPEGFRIYGQTLNTQGSLYLAQGQTRDAWQAWKNATDQYQTAGYTEGVVKSLLNQAQALRRLGFFRRSSDRISDAETILNHQIDSILKAELYLSMGKTQRLLGDLDKSNENLKKAEKIASSLQLSEEIMDRILLSRGITQQTDAKNQAALAERIYSMDSQQSFYKDALDTYEKMIGTASTITNTKIHARLNQLAIYIDLKQWDKVEALSKSLTDDIDILLLGRQSSFARLTLARLLLDVLEYRCDNTKTSCTAIENLQKSVPQQAYDLLAIVKAQTSREMDPIMQSYALGYLGHLYELDGKTTDAQRLTQEAITLTNRSNVVYQWQWQLGRLTNNLNNQESSLKYYKNAFENVKTVRDDLLYVSPDARFDFRDRIEPLYREYVSLLLSPNQVSAHTKNTSNKTQEALEQAQEVINNLRVAELENFLACGLLEANSQEPLSFIDEIASIDQDTAIIYPIILDDRLEVLVQLPNQSEHQIKTYPSNLIQAKLLEEKLKEFRKELEQPYFSTERGVSRAKELYDWLIAPAEDQGWLESMDTLVFVLDGAFRNIPMAALYDQRSEQFLIEKFAIAVTFGDLKVPTAPPTQDFRILSAGLSKDPGPLPTQNGTEQEDIFGPLIHVENEINQISKASDSFLNSMFTEDRVRKAMRLSNYNVVHFATHGEFGFTRDKTYLLAAADQQTGEAEIETTQIKLETFDNLLVTRDRTPLELLTLSACETAEGDDREVLGMAGLAVQTGARATLSTLWSINDLSTSFLMQNFYELVSSNKSQKAKALQEAQIKLIEKGYTPSIWAPYLMVGDWR